MSSKQQVHNLIILDESGSMNSIKPLIIEGFNELVQSVKGIEKKFPEQEHSISLLTFNSANRKLLHFLDPISKLKTINSDLYQPDAMTPLFDAMGYGISKLRSFLEGKTNYNVLVTILTDGEENSSTEYSKSAIKNLVEELKSQNWTFTYIGTDHDVSRMAESLSIKHSLSFEKNVSGIKKMFSRDRDSRAMYSYSLSLGKKNEHFFIDDPEEDESK